MCETLRTIRQVARQGIAPESYLRRLEAQGKLPGVYSGRTKLVNVPLLLEQLNRESAENARGGE